MCKGSLFHKWSDWNDEESMTIKKIDDNNVIGHMHIQMRVCAKCHLKQRKSTHISSSGNIYHS